MLQIASAPLLASRGLVAVPQDGPAFNAAILKARERWAKVVKESGAKFD